MALLLTDPIPLTEYYSRTLKDYKGLQWNTITPENSAKIVRVNNLSDEEFRELVRKAYPFVVDDCAPKAQLQDMPCSEYGRRWPNEHMKAEYTPGQSHIYLRDPTWHTVQNPTAKAKMHLSEGKPIAGPYVWHVKDEMEDPRTKPTLQKMFPVPYFLNSSVLNSQEALDSFEMWFALENGGTQAHADAYCETAVSLQLRGRKRWRMGAFPNITNAFQPWSFHDGEIYRSSHLWAPEYEMVVEPGQCIVFPMGYIHETYIAEGDGGDDGCSVATTFQMQDPQPVYQWKNFLTRWGLSHYAREEPCLERMTPYVFLGRQHDVKGSSDEAIQASARGAFQALDKDGDGKLTFEELKAEYAKTNFRPPWSEVRNNQEILRAAAKEKVEWESEDALLYHDEDKDGKVSFEEYQDSVLKFLAVWKRFMSIKKAKKKSSLFNKEEKWIRKYMCTADDCNYLEQLKADYSRASGKQSRQDL